MRFISLLVLLQSIWFCAARPMNLQSATLAANTDEILTPQDVVSGFEEWLKPKPNGKDKETDDDCLCGDGLERYEQGTNKPETSLNQGEVPDLDRLDRKVNGSVSNGTNNDTKPNCKPDVKSKGEPKVQPGESNPKSNSTNGHMKSLEWHDKRCFGTYQFGKHKDIYLEEERLPFYRRQVYYPMRIGQVIQQNYQVVAKLGYGTTSTVWLSRDLRDGTFWVLKVHINTLKHSQELAVYKHLSSLDLDHAGRQHVGEVRDTFKLRGPHGEHEVFVMSPLGMSLRTLQELQKDSVFQRTLVTSALDQTLLGLNYLHDADVIHTDIHSDNLLVALTDDSVLSTVEDNELHRPSARKFVDETVIHVSQYMLGGAGALTICDLGQARIGKVHRGNAMPLPYRAPEVILGMTWGNSVDAWSVGLLAWDLLHKNGIFRVYDNSENLNDAHHLAAMTALLGPPPDVFLRRSDKTRKYWDAQGKWRGPVPLPSEGGLQFLETNLSGEDRTQFLDFLAGMLTWLPEGRLNSAGAYFHPWLRGEGGVEQ